MIRTNLIIDLELEFDLALNSTSTKMTSCCISPNHSILPCNDHASYCGIALIVFFLSCRCLSPLGRCVPMTRTMTPMNCVPLQKCQASKTPLFILILIPSHARALFYFIRTTTTHMLLAAVVKPLFLCMTCHCHSK